MMTWEQMEKKLRQQDEDADRTRIKIPVEYKSGLGRLWRQSVDYMLATVDDIELYAELPRGETECDTYDDLVDAMLKQAVENGIDIRRLRFWFDVD